MNSSNVNENAGEKLSWVPVMKEITPISDSSTVCFSIQDVSISDEMPLSVTTEIGGHDSLKSYLQSHPPDSYSIRAIHLFQRDSWSSLRINAACFDRLVKHHNVTNDFRSIAAMFSLKRNAVEEAFCGPILQNNTTQYSELAYVFKYPEQKKSLSNMQEEWVIRQIGVYQQLSKATGKSVWILLHCSEKSSTISYVTDLLKDLDGLEAASKDPEVLHLLLFSCYINNWRGYLAFYESELLNKTNKALGARLQDLPRVSYDTITRVRYLETKLVSLPSIFASLKSVLNVLEGVTAAESRHPYQGYIGSYSSLIDSYTFSVNSLLRRCSSLSQFIVESTAHTQSESQLRLTQVTVQDSVSIKVITILTLIYLPASFVATFFGMQFFQFKNASLWIFFVGATVLTIITMIGWWWSVLRKRKIVGLENDIEMARKAV